MKSTSHRFQAYFVLSCPRFSTDAACRTCPRVAMESTTGDNEAGASGTVTRWVQTLPPRAKAPCSGAPFRGQWLGTLWFSTPAFEQFETGSGFIDREEFVESLTVLGLKGLRTEYLYSLFSQWDDGSTGRLDARQFVDLVQKSFLQHAQWHVAGQVGVGQETEKMMSGGRVAQDTDTENVHPNSPKASPLQSSDSNCSKLESGEKTPDAGRPSVADHEQKAHRHQRMAYNHDNAVLSRPSTVADTCNVFDRCQHAGLDDRESEHADRTQLNSCASEATCPGEWGATAKPELAPQQRASTKPLMRQATKRTSPSTHASSDLRDHHASAGGHTFQVKEDGQVSKVHTQHQRHEDAPREHDEPRRFRGHISARSLAALADMQQGPASTRALHTTQNVQNASSSKPRSTFIHTAPLSCWDAGCRGDAGHSSAAFPLPSLDMSHALRYLGHRSDTRWPTSRSYTQDLHAQLALQPLRPRAPGNPPALSHNICRITSAHASISAMSDRGARGSCDPDTCGRLRLAPFQRAATAGSTATGLRGLCRARPQLRPLTVPQRVNISRRPDHAVVGQQQMLRKSDLGGLPVRKERERERERESVCE